ncbi:MAG: asparagine synthase (glutamine-hydrolyzing) [Acidobacteriota bacterium]|nr:asparagine synthase (glutamine-hydrolyzing) [Acidobacteriota bacterium]
MCGIAGILTAEAGRSDMRPALDAMQSALRHRGPDDRGQWRSPSGLAAFAHTRLAILDLSPAGHQPMSTADGRYTVVFNGEIYNFLELRRTLAQKGAAFSTRSDTEVILRAYQAYGDRCVELFRGMFAFAVWDEREQTCLLARDRFGLKPLYYHVGRGGLVFGSEVRALLASGLVARELDPRAVYQYFRTGSIPEPRTLLRSVQCLEAGHHARWHAGRLERGRYWALRFPTETMPALDAVAATRAALLDSVEQHFVSDVPVGVFLSGGIDSTALVALASANGHKGLQTFSLSLPGVPSDEGAAARRVAVHFATQHQDYPVDAATGRAIFSKFLGAFDQPSIDGLNTFALAGFARERGVTVALSGLGADEIFGGYPSFTEVPRLARWDLRLSRFPLARRAVGHALEGVAPGHRGRRLGDMLGQPAGLLTAYATFRGIYTRAEARQLVEHYGGATEGEPEDDMQDVPTPDPTTGDAVSRLELTRYVRNQLLRESDVMSMAWGLELRTPFLDAAVIDAVGRVPAVTRLRAGKRLLLDAVPEVPGWVAHQPKRCFQLPFEQWLDGEWRQLFAEVSRTCPVPTETWYRKWSVFMLERWVERMTTSASIHEPVVPGVGRRVHG